MSNLWEWWNHPATAADEKPLQLDPSWTKTRAMMDALNQKHANDANVWNGALTDQVWATSGNIFGRVEKVQAPKNDDQALEYYLHALNYTNPAIDKDTGGVYFTNHQYSPYYESVDQKNSAINSAADWLYSGYAYSPYDKPTDIFETVAKAGWDAGKDITWNQIANAIRAQPYDNWSWWGTEARKAALINSFGLDATGYFDPQLAQRQGNVAAARGMRAQAGAGGGDDFFLSGLPAAVSLAAGFGFGLGAMGASEAGGAAGLMSDGVMLDTALGGMVAPNAAAAEAGVLSGLEGSGLGTSAAMDAGFGAAADTAFPAAGAVSSTMPVVEFGSGASALGGSALAEAGADAAAGANGGGSGMDWLDELLNSAGGDPLQWANTGTNASDMDILESLSNGGTNSAGWNPLQYSADAADAAQGTGMTSPTNNLLTTQGKMQALMDAGLPWDVVSKIPVGNLGNVLNLMKGVMGGSSGSPLSRIMGGNGSTSDWLSLGGAGIGGLLDYMSSSKQADAMKAIADRSWAAGQPYRDRANAAMTPGFDVKSIPGLSSAMDTATETYLRKLSATNGNPAGIGAAPSQTEAFVLGNVALPAWQNYFNANSNAGGLSNLSAQANGTAQNAAAADAGIYGSLGQTARNIFDPQPNNTQYLRSIFGLA